MVKSGKLFIYKQNQTEGIYVLLNRENFTEILDPSNFTLDYLGQLIHPDEKSNVHGRWIRYFFF